MYVFELKENDVHAYRHDDNTNRSDISETDMYNAIIHTERLEFEATKKETTTNLNYSTLQPISSSVARAYDLMFVLSYPHEVLTRNNSL